MEDIKEKVAEAPEVEEKDEYEVVGVRFKSTGKVYYFDPRGLTMQEGECAIVETARGLEYGFVSMANKVVPRSHVFLPLRPVIRRATDADRQRYEENQVKEVEAGKICCRKVEEHNLKMKIVDVEYTFDNSKLLFYFTSDGRVDFRELVKDLASVFKTRIELRQIGIRDETKMVGGLGVCGMPYCCKKFLDDFGQVTIKMAKEQNLALNTQKLSGACGRLMCCLRYEQNAYEDAMRSLPKMDSIVQTPDGEGTVCEIAPLTGLVKVKFKAGDQITIRQYPGENVKVLVAGADEESPDDDKDVIEETEFEEE